MPPFTLLESDVMSLIPEAIITDTNEVWSYIDPTSQADKDTFEPMMEDWINAASLNLENYLNRPIVKRTFDEYQNGNGRSWMYVRNYPIIDMHTVEIQTWDLLVTYQINVARSARQFVLDHETGKATMLPFGPVGHFIYGQQNIHFVYEAGFTGSQLAPFKDAVRELISIVWREIGVHPLELVRSDNIGNNVSFTKFDPRRLPFTTQQLINNYSRLGT